jgi:hypothetical protein
MREPRVILSGEKRKSECAKDPDPRPPLALGGWGSNERVPRRFVWRNRKSECAKDPDPRPPLALGGWGVLCIDESRPILCL